MTLAVLRGRARSSGAPLEQPVAQIQTFRDGKIARFELYPDRDEALRAAGFASDSA